MVLIEVFVSDERVFIDFTINFKIVHFKVTCTHLSVNILRSAKNFTKVGQCFFNFWRDKVTFLDFGLTNGCAKMWVCFESIKNIRISSSKSSVKEAEFYISFGKEISSSFGNLSKFFVAKICRLWHKSVIVNVTHLDVDLLDFIKCTSKVIDS